MQRPLVLEWVPFDSKPELDRAKDGANLVFFVSLATIVLKRGLETTLGTRLTQTQPPEIQTPIRTFLTQGLKPASTVFLTR